MSRTSKGRAMVNLLELREGETTCAYLSVKNFEAGSKFLTFVSRDGIVKRTALKEYRNVNRSGIIAVGLKEGDALLSVTLTDGNDDIILVTAHGQAIRFNEKTPASWAAPPPASRASNWRRATRSSAWSRSP
jgi:DNA gyrase subunit A